MKFVQTFWIDEGKDALEASFGWCSAKYHLMSWALSCLQLTKIHSNVELVTDSRGKELLIDKLKLPYQHVRVVLDELDFDCSPLLWVMKKIYSYTLHDGPFLNVDGDVYIFKPFPNEVLSGNLIAQNIEQDFDYYRELVGLIHETFDFVPLPIKEQIKRGKPIQASNAGIFGGHDYSFFSDYFQFVKTFVAENREKINQLTPAQMVNFNAVVEQYIFHCLSSDRQIAVKYLLDTVYDPSFFEAFANFHYLPNEISFMHALGDYKKNGWVCDQLANRLRIDYPEYYDRIIGLLEPRKKGLIESIAIDGFEETITKDLSFRAKYLAKPEKERFYRTHQIMSFICENEQITFDKSGLTAFQCKELLDKELTDLNSVAILNDVFGFENEKKRLIQSLPSVNTIWANEAEAADGANRVFNESNFLESAELSLSLFCMTIESEWDWAQNHILFTRVKGNNFENNLNLPPHYYQTLLLLDKHHGEVIEYLLGPMEAYLLSLLTKEEFIPITEVIASLNSFFVNIREAEILVYLEEAIRFMGYSGVLVLRLTKKNI